MPLDQRAKRFLDRLAALNPPNALSLSVAERRAALQHMLDFSCGHAAVGAVEDTRVPATGGPVRLRIYTPAEAPPGALGGLVYFHGGGLVAGTLESHEGICRSLCAA